MDSRPRIRARGQYVVYQVGRSVYVYDMETQTVKELFLPMIKIGKKIIII